MNKMLPRPIPEIVKKEFQKNKNIRVRVLIVLIKNQRVFFLKSIINCQEAWFLPGGSVKSGEPLSQAARREMKEELDIRVDNLKVISIIDCISPRNDYHMLEIIFSAHTKNTPVIKEEPLIPGEKTENQYSIEGAWLTLKQLSKMNAYPRNFIKKVLPMYLKSKKLSETIYLGIDK